MSKCERSFPSLARTALVQGMAVCGTIDPGHDDYSDPDDYQFEPLEREPGEEPSPARDAHEQPPPARRAPRSAA